MPRFQKARKYFKRLLWALAAALFVFVVAGVAVTLHCKGPRGNFQPSAPAQTSSSRPEDDTFLTYSEWYIVWSYQEKAEWQQSKLPSGFSYFGAIRQYWSGYCLSCEVVHGRYPFNFGDHLMLVVIGTSFTVEYALKGLYENTVGRLTESVSDWQPTDEDRFAAKVAKDYGLFVQDRPFYEFPFFKALRGLWSETKLWGPHAVRKWERKAWLSLDYGVEAVYCGIITLASHMVYGVEEDVTHATVEYAPEAVQNVKMPRYQKFTTAAIQLLKNQARFVEIEGNRQIMVTAIVPRDWRIDSATGEELFESYLLTDGNRKRVAIRIPVSDLGELSSHLEIEHIYDY